MASADLVTTVNLRKADQRVTLWLLNTIHDTIIYGNGWQNLFTVPNQRGLPCVKGLAFYIFRTCGLPCSEGMKAKSIWVTSCEVGLLSSTCHAWTFLASSCKCQSDRLSPYGEQRNQSFLCIKPTRNWHFDESLEGLATWAPWKLSRQVCWFTLCHRPNYLLQSIWHCSQLRRVYTLEAFAQLPNADPWKNNAGLKQILAIACIKACANLPIHGCSLSGSIFSHLSVRTTAFWRPQLSWRDFAYAAISIHDSAQPTSTPMAL